jgi:NAD(P)-dependent dehydrogenase (short-subunit alcohol dehydrogenase family)
LLRFCHLYSHIIIISEAFKTTIKKFGDIDIVVNNAGLCNEKKWKYVVSVNIVSSKKIKRGAYIEGQDLRAMLYIILTKFINEHQKGELER